jgi:pimeloyl-ACP methyl ester carboxylesterase
MTELKTKSHNGLVWTEAGAADAPPVIFIGGYGCNKEVWRHQLPIFGKHFRAIALDMPGHGASEAKPEVCSIHGYGEIVNGLRRHLRLHRPLLVGHSMGGRVALEASRQAPLDSRGLVLLDVSRAVSPDHDPQERERLSTGESHKKFRAHMRRMFDENFSPTCPQEIKDEIRASSRALDHACADALTPTIGRWDHEYFEEALRTLPCRLYVLQSTYLIYGQSRIILEVGQETPYFEMIRNHVPGARIDWHQTGHFSMLEKPVEITNHLLAFAHTLA